MKKLLSLTALALLFSHSFALAQTVPTAFETQVGDACSKASHSSDFDTLVQCSSTDGTAGTLQKAPLFVGQVTAPPYADVTCDAAKEGMIQYTGTEVQFCNGTTWGSMAGTTASGGQSMHSGFPDAIRCTEASGDVQTFINVAASLSSDGDVIYRQIRSPTNATDRNIRYTSAGVYETHSDVATIDCVTNAWSIADLISNGKAFNFTNGGGGVNEVPVGTAGAPGLYFTGDDNTGVYRPAADTVAVAAAGVEVLRVSATGVNLYDITQGYGIAGNTILHQPANDTTSIAVGTNALAVQTGTNLHNTAVGNIALANTTTGASNTALGSYSLYSNINGRENTAVGTNALQLSTAGIRNTALGFYALRLNQTDNQTAMGYRALGSNTTGSSNTAIGYFALSLNATGGYNVGVGYSALYKNKAGNNTAIGASALYNTVTGASNTAVGSYALYNSTGASNIAMGASTLVQNTTGHYNTGLGTFALNKNTTGSSNTALGYNVGSTTLTTGSNNILIGTSNTVDTPLADTSNWLNIGNTIYGDLTAGSVAIGGTATGVTAGATLDMSNVTDSMITPKGTTAQQPTGVEGMIRYNTESNSFEGYSGSTPAWASLGSGSAASGGQSMYAGWPDAIICSDATTDMTLYHAQKVTADGTHRYRYFSDSFTYYVLYASAGTYSTNSNLGSFDCVTSTHSISYLVANGKAFNLTNGGGGVNEVPVGTAGAPGLYFTGDENTGVYRPAADTVAWATAGTEKMRLSAAGNLGFGATDPTAGSNLDLSSKTDSILVPKGTTAQQPTGVEGMIRYNTESNSFEGYSGSTPAWASLGGGSAASGGQSMVEGWPDAIMCNSTIGGNTGPRVLYLNNAGWSTLFYYVEPIAASGGTTYWITFTAAGNYNSQLGYTSTDCNESIATLVSNGKAFNFVNGGSGVNEVPVGTAGAPGLYFTGDDNTGVYRPAADTVAIAAGGVEVLRVSATGVNLYDITQGYGIGGNTVLHLPIGDTTSIAVGVGSLSSRTTTSNGYNVAVGSESLQNTTTGALNTALGRRSMYFNLGGGQNTALGYEALRGNTYGDQNVAVGKDSLYASTDGSYNVAIGTRALYNKVGGGQNIALGQAALLATVTGSNNIGIGYGVGSATLATGSNNILIGTDTAVDTPLADTSNWLNIGNTIFGDLTAGSVAIGGTATGVTAGATLDMSNVTDSMITPKGTTAQQPTGVEGMIRYNTETNSFEGYSGSTPAWASLGSGSAAASGGQSMVAGWPDAIVCSEGAEKRVLWLMYASDASTIYLYLNSGSYYRVDYNSDGSYKSQQSLAGIDCVTNAWSISELIANGKAFNVTNGGGGVNEVPVGTAGAPGLYFTGDENTGVYRPAADTVAWATAGTEKMRLSAAGNLGFGAADPTAGTNLDLSSKTDSILVPKGTTAQQPTGVEGMIRYNTETNSFEGYSGSTPAWASLGSGSAASGGQSLLAGWPDVIVCDISGRNANFYQDVAPNSSGKYQYRRNIDTTTYSLEYNSDGSFYTSTGAGATHDCVANTWSISYLVANGKAFNLTNGGGGVNEVPVGTAGAPGLYFTGDDNTGVYRPAADTVAIAAGGVEVLRVSATGVNLYDITQGYGIGGNTVLHQPAGDTTSFGAGPNALGAQTLTGRSNTAVGSQALGQTVTGSFNTAVGALALTSNTTGLYNTAVGTSALSTNATGTGNTAFGANASMKATAASYVTAVGYFALFNNLENNNNALGYQALFNNTTGSGNDAFGRLALSQNKTGSYNAAFGLNTLYSTKGNTNTAFGAGALYSTATANNNTAVGRYAGLTNETGSNNTIFGYEVAKYTLTSGSNNILIGTSSAVTTPAADTSNWLNIGNTIYGDLTAGSVAIGGTATGVTAGATLDMSNVTDSMITPKGTTAQQPTGVEGMIRYNTETNSFEGYSGSSPAWTSLGSGSAASGGQSINEGFPDVIRCYHSSNDAYFNLYNVYTNNAAGRVMYRYNQKPTSADDYYMYYDAVGAVYGNSNMAGFDCLTNNWSISEVIANGRAFNITNGGGGVNEVPVGTAGAPGLYFTGDENTGVYRPAADTVAWATAGTEKMRLSAAGNLGFGAADPTAGTNLDLSSKTDSILVPKGTTAQQPTGVEGMIRYNTETNSFEGYSGSTPAWASLGGGSAASGGQSMYAGFPDAIVCTDASFKYTYYHYAFSPGTGNHTYKLTHHTLVISLVYTSSGAYSTHANSGTYDCVTSAKSIATLIADGQAFNTVNGGGGVNEVPIGTAGAPGLYFTGDENTGVYRPEADAVAVATNGVEVLRVSSTGVNLYDVTQGYGIAGNTVLHQPASDTTSLAVGASALTSQTATNLHNTAVGNATLYSNTTGSDNSAFGYLALRMTTTGTQNSAFGSLSQYTNTGKDNSSLGYATLRYNTTGNGNSAFGTEALTQNITGAYNTGFGNNALLNNLDGNSNTAVGNLAMHDNTSGHQNEAFGSSSLYRNTTGQWNVAIGSNALNRSVAADRNVAVGNMSLYNTTSGSNTAIGMMAGYKLTAGESNLFAGPAVGSVTLTTGSNNILIGTSNAVDTPLADTSNWLNIGNTIYGDLTAGSVAIGGTATGVTAGATLDMSNVTDSMITPKGTTAQQPTGVEGMIRYNTESNSFEGYSGSSPAWTSLGSGSAASGGQSMVAGFPDVIVCRTADNAYDITLYHGISRASNGEQTYKYLLDGGKFEVVYNAGGSYLSTTGLSSYDCVSSAYAISWLVSNGRAFNFVNGGGGVNEVPVGTAGAPGLYFTGDENTGVYRPAADTVAWATAGTEKMRLSAAGNLGFGATDPTAGSNLDLSSKTDSILVPKGTTAQQPTGVEGMIRYNTETNSFEGYSGSTPAWASLGSGSAASGGQSMHAGFPDAIHCESSTSTSIWLYLAYTYADNRVLYRWTSPPASTTDVWIIFGTNGDFDNSNGASTQDCVTNTWSIADLIANGRAFNTTNGGGGVNEVPVGTAGAPGLYFTGDENTGVYRPEADTVAVAAAGVEVLRVSATGVNLYDATAGYSIGDDTVLDYPSGDAHSIAVGKWALFSQTATNLYNTAVGREALYSTTTGERNTAVGRSALIDNLTGKWNTALGAWTLGDNTTGSGNTALGYLAGRLMTTADNNTAVGNQSLSSTTTGTSNTAVGAYSLNSNTTGTLNTAVGTYALQKTTTGYENTAIGYQSLNNNLNGRFNSAVGSSTLSANTSGMNNNAFGYRALIGNKEGSGNNAFGNYALQLNTTSHGSVAIGHSALNASVTGEYNTAVGYWSLLSTTGMHNVALGAEAGKENTTGTSNVFVGYKVGSSTLSTGSNNILIGTSAAVDVPTASTSSWLNIGNTIYGDLATNSIALGGTATGVTAGATLDMSNVTDSMITPKGTTAQQPTGVEGMIRYNTESNSFEGYSGSTPAWASLGSGSAAASGGQSLFEGWPDAIVCSNASNEDVVLYHWMAWNASGRHFYVWVESASNKYIDYATDGTYNSHLSMSAYDCVSNSRSIDWLVANGKAFNTVNGGGGVNEVPVGTAGAPGLYFTGDENTGVYRPAADTVAWATAGTEKMRLSAAGNLGFGAADPTAGSNLDLSSKTDSILVPKGTTAQQPTGVEGMIRYNTESNSFEGYSGSTPAWTSLGSGSAASGGQSIHEGFPDAITCINGTDTFTYLHYKHDTGTATHRYRLANDVYDLTINYADSGAYSSSSATSATHDCAVNAWSISYLVANGKAFNFTNGGGGVNEVPVGTAGAPGLYFTGDENTGVYRPEADAVAIAAGGVEVLRVSSTGVNLYDITQGYGIAGNTVLHQPASDTTSIAVGSGSLAAQTATNKYNTAVGYRSLFKNTTGKYNTALGSTALNDVLIGNNNVAVGHQALSLNLEDNNTAVGYNALWITSTGERNTALGSMVLVNNVASYNTAAGYMALNKNTSGEKNTALGYLALFNITSGANNVGIGPNVGQTTISTGSNNILIGTSVAVDTPLAATSNWLNIGNTIYGDLSTGSVALGGTATGVTAGATLDMSNVTDSMITPKGTTAQQPTGVEGMIRYNTETNSFEGYSGATPTWASLGGGSAASGGQSMFDDFPDAITCSTTVGQYTFIHARRVISNGNHLYQANYGTNYYSMTFGSTGTYNATGGDTATFDCTTNAWTIAEHIANGTAFNLTNGGGGVNEVPVGTAGAPGLYFTGDENTGVYRPAADTVAISVAGAEVLRIEASALTVPKGTTAQQPTGVEGMIRYNTETNSFEGYSGSSPAWQDIGGGSAASGEQSMIEGWPDAIVCNQSGGDPRVFYATQMPTGSVFTYQRIHISTLYDVRFNADGSYSAHNNISAYDCVTNAWSIAELKANGKAFNLTNGGGGVNEVPVGTAGAPGLYFTGDANTGVYRPAADTVAISVAGAEALRIEASALTVPKGTTAQQPTGVEGMIRYNTETNSFEGYSGSTPEWASLGGSGSGASGGQSMADGFPDVIVCTGGSVRSLYISNLPSSGNYYHYRMIDAYTDAQIKFTAAGVYDSHVGMTDYDCKESALSISYLVANGKAFNLTNGGGGVNEVPVGTAGAPGLYFTGDENTGVYHPEADTVAISTGGTEALRVTATGSMGFGTTTPSATIDLNGGDIDIGYERKTATCVSVNTCSVSCSSGKQIMGGGCSMTVYGDMKNYPSSTSAWMCIKGNASGNITAYALCANVK